MIDRRPRPSSHERWWKPLAALAAASTVAAVAVAAVAAQQPVDFSGVTGGSSIRAGSGTLLAPPPPPTPRFDRAAVPSSGRQVAEMTVEAFGRYSVRVKSASGTITPASTMCGIRMLK